MPVACQALSSSLARLNIVRRNLRFLRKRLESFGRSFLYESGYLTCCARAFYSSVVHRSGLRVLESPKSFPFLGGHFMMSNDLARRFLLLAKVPMFMDKKRFS